METKSITSKLIPRVTPNASIINLSSQIKCTNITVNITELTEGINSQVALSKESANESQEITQPKQKLKDHSQWRSI